MKKFLVTGGLGFIGSNLIEELKKDAEVVCVDDLSSSRPDYENLVKQNEKVEYVQACYSSPKILDRVKAGEFNGVFHVAAVPRVLYSVENPSKTTDINVNKTVELIEACVEGEIERFVFSSSSSVYGGADVLPTPTDYPKDPKSPYAWQKSTIEDFIKLANSLYGIDAVCLRYFNVFGPGQYGGSAYATAISAWCHAIKNKKPLRKDGSGEQSRDMCYIDNVVQANIQAMNSEMSFTGECYNVACGDRVSNNDILKYFENKFGSLDITNAPFRAGDVMHTLADISSSRKDLGYEPTVRFWEGLDKTLTWWDLN